MKKKIYHTGGAVPKSYRKIVEIEVKFIPLTHKYMTARFHSLVQVLQYKVVGLN